MEYKYYRELKHNYLVAKSNALDYTNKDSYQVRILKTGNLKGFVPCDVRIINNEYFLYYKINSLQSIRDRFTSRGMRAEQLLKLFSGLKDALEGLSEYLLGIENVVLDAGSIFTDLNTGEFYFLYCPFQEDDKGFSSFIDELYELVDHDDEKAVELVYSCSEKAQSDGALVLELIGEMLENEPGEKQDSPEAVCEISESTEDLLSDDDFEIDCEEEAELSAGKMQKLSGKITGKVQVLFSFLFFILVAAMVFIRMNYILTEGENMLSIVVMLVSMVTGIVSFLSGIKDILAKASSKDAGEKESLPEEEDNYPEGADTWEETEDIVEPIDMTPYKSRISVGSSVKGGDETVLLDVGEEENRDITLYSRNTDKTLRINLAKLPLTVGKLQGCVDNVINDKSVSRIHCRFSKDQDGRISVTDLNSTNGTFRNGLRLNPQEATFIEEGDEVRIGRICFDCR
ncbi:MAG: FHA domain-containing protein [Butyrivibrio sp.]|nr:FHA domain-containing protein [Butyrivibrio sp.]